jgi:nitronate monooxygenase
MTIQELFGIRLPVIQAPMAGWQDSDLAIAVCNAGGLGSLPCAMLTADGLRAELQAIKAATDQPYNVNFFCHTPPTADAKREAAWRELLAPYFREYGIDQPEEAGAVARTPFSAAAADVLEQELGPINDAAPAFPLAADALAPLRRKAESLGCGDFSLLWAGQNTSGCQEISATELTRALIR